MKKGWKIALISVGSVLGLIIVIFVVACWLIFTPARLTSIVNKLAGDNITCENHFERVDLTLFKTFPNVGLDVQNVTLINPYQVPADNIFAPKVQAHDTLAHIGSLTIGIDLRAFLKERHVIVRQVLLDDAQANIYTSPDGWSNLSIFKASDEEDTTSSETTLPDIIQIEKIKFSNLSANYCDLQQNIMAKVDNLNLDLSGSYQNKKIDADLFLGADQLLVNMLDSLGKESVFAHLGNPSIDLDAKGAMASLEGKLKLTLPKGDVSLAGTRYTTDAMQVSRHDLLTIKMPFSANLDNMSVTLGEGSSLSLLDYDLDLSGDVTLARDGQPMEVDVKFGADRWQIADLLAILPSFITESLKGMDVDAKATINGMAKGVVADGRLPQVKAQLVIEKGSFSAPKMLPMPVKDIEADLVADLNLSTDSTFKGPSNVLVNNFSAKAKKTTLSLNGNIEDLLGDMLVDATIKGDINLPDLKPFLPDTMPIALNGTTKADLKIKSRLSDITNLALQKINANGTLQFKKMDVTYDSIHAESPSLNLALELPTKRTSKKVSELIGAHITGGKLDVTMASNNLDAHINNPDIQVALPNILDDKQSLAASFNIKFSKLVASMDSMSVNTDTLSLKGSIRNDEKQDNILKQWNPDVDIDLHRGVLTMTGMDEPLRLSNFRFNYKPEVCDISKVTLLWGVSDYHLSGKLYGIEDWLSHKEMLHGDLNFSSTYADIDQLMDILSGMGTPEDTLAQQRVEDNVPKEANPFIVPKDVNVKLNTRINRCLAFGNDLNDLQGSVTVNDGVAVLDQVGFTCKAARMELTGIYKSPRVNHLFVGLDFHLLDIRVDELLDMIPSIDTIVPMLKAFEGNANFHLAAECNLNAYYQPKMSTLIGAAAISGKDLIVMDNSTIATLAKLLQFKNWREKDNNIGIDSISVEAQVFRKEVIVYPFLLGLHNYQLCIGGRHTLDNNCNYHLELIKCPLPMRLAVDVNGKLQKPNIKLGTVQYAEMYKPEKRDELQTRTLELKRKVRQALEANVRQKKLS